MQTINKITPFFLGWSETLIWSCLQGCMGNFITDNANNPTAALIVVGDFCFCGGTPNNALVAKAAAPINPQILSISLYHLFRHQFSFHFVSLLKP